MMKVLTGPKTSFEAKREAAENLASLNEERHLQTTIYPAIIGPHPPRPPNPAVAKFSEPTVAEAVLFAMDADLKAYDAGPDGGLKDYSRRSIEDGYLFALVALEDRRISAELARRSASADTIRMRRKWAYAAHWLGEPGPFKRYAADFRTGKIKLPANDQPHTNDTDQPGNAELLGAVQYLTSAATAEADRALFALAEPLHPYHRLAADRIRNDRVEWSSETAWFAHPYCLAILRRELDNTKLTGSVFKIDKDRLRYEHEGGYSSGGIPADLANPATRRKEARERACDAAAEKVHKLVIGVPFYHPLFKDGDDRLAKLRAALDRFAGSLRRATRRECEVFDRSPWDPTFIPGIRSLGRAATAADVTAGKAIFHLDGNGRVADLTLPAVAVLKRDEKKERPPHVLIVQAEVSADGQVTYGIIMKEDIGAVSGRALTGIKPFAEIDKEEKEAGKKEKGKKD